MYGRTGVLDGNSINLRVVFVDAEGNFITPENPQLYIYSPDVDGNVIDAEVEAGVFASAAYGPLIPSAITVGFYEYVFAVPAGLAAGVYVDTWVAYLNGTLLTTKQSFSVLNGAFIKVQQLFDNELIIVALSTDIVSYDGLQLEVDTQLSFITKLVPFYASPDLIRVEAGPWLDWIPDSTLALMSHWSSQEADFIQGGRSNNSKRLSFARAKFVSYDATLKALYLPGSYNYQPTGILGGSKALGDLSIGTTNGGVVSRTSSGIDVNTLNFIKSNREEWFRVVNAGGNIVPGQSVGNIIEVASRGKYDPARRNAGRQWEEPSETYYQQPGTNAKNQSLGYKKGKLYWQPTYLGTRNYDYT